MAVEKAEDFLEGGLRGQQGDAGALTSRGRWGRVSVSGQPPS